MKAKQKIFLLQFYTNEREAIMHAYKNAKPGSFITIMCDVVPDALDYIKKLKEEEEREFKA